MFNKSYILFLFLLLSCYEPLKAQVFTMSSTGSFNGTTSMAAPIQFKSVNTCIDVQSGVAVLTGKRNNGEFAINCEVGMKNQSLGIKVFPVPTTNTAQVKFIQTPPLEDEFTLTIFTIDGRQLLQRKEKGYSLFQGVSLDVSHLSPGTYVLKIESAKYMDVVKFIKA